MKEMVYKSERCDAELLACDTYKGFDYYVVSRGMHPCAYVDIKHYDKAINAKTINCHGGITYSESTLDAADHDGWFIAVRTVFALIVKYRRISTAQKGKERRMTMTDTDKTCGNCVSCENTSACFLHSL